MGDGRRFGGKPRLTSQCLRDAGEEVDVVFLQSAQVGTDPTKVGRPRFRAEAARDFLLNLHHAHVPLGLVVGPRDVGIMEEAQRFRLTIAEVIEQAEDFAAGGPAAFGWADDRRGGIGRIAGAPGGFITCGEGGDLGRRDDFTAAMIL